MKIRELLDKAFAGWLELFIWNQIEMVYQMNKGALSIGICVLNIIIFIITLTDRFID